MQQRAILIAFFCVPIIGGLIAVRAQSTSRPNPVPQESKPSAVLVELFTSEGCSSCPPADELLRKIEGKHTDSGQLIVGISEHVTYWNQLGWSDPFSDQTYTRRQNAYGTRFGLDSVYTPQMVINGEEQIVGSDSSSLLRAVQKEAHRPQLDIHIASASISGNVLTVDFSMDGDAPGKGVDIFAVLAEDAVSSDVLRGENGGRTLSHVSVAKTITRVASFETASERTIHIPLAASVVVPSGHGRHLILFAQAAGLGRVLGVDTKPL